MRFEAEQLKAILRVQERDVVIYPRKLRVSPIVALGLVGRYFGIGNRHFIRHLRPVFECPDVSWIRKVSQEVVGDRVRCDQTNLSPKVYRHIDRLKPQTQ
jgi:hypothetical protein